MQLVTSIIAETLLQSVELARHVEALGYDAVATQENQHDPFLPLAAAAVATERVRLVTSIALAFTRSPVATAYTGWDLHVSSHGRFVLGLGTQVKGHNERRFSVPWTAPAPRIREVVDVIRAIWRCFEHGDALDYSGEHYQVSLMPPNFRPAPKRFDTTSHTPKAGTGAA